MTTTIAPAQAPARDTQNRAALAALVTVTLWASAFHWNPDARERLIARSPRLRADHRGRACARCHRDAVPTTTAPGKTLHLVLAYGVADHGWSS